MKMPQRLSIVGELEMADHYYLTPQDKCYFWGEYTPYEHTGGQGWNFSPTNQLISNLKKKMDKKGAPGWGYKQKAIEVVGRSFSEFWKWGKLIELKTVLVPIPPSKLRSDPLYDPRMLQVLNVINGAVGGGLDIRDCLIFKEDLGASHELMDRPSPDELYNNLEFDDGAGRCDDVPGVVFLFDDMLTTGAHYVACARKLKEVFPRVDVVGNFVSRRRFPSFDGDEF
ncbi:hypothetical protein Q8W80_28070 [Pseudomonas aeruginosa]|uniref:hypothetical protein n=1 Tax=Pseudomonas aeruginosa TaxID=287 RepID=UPI0010682611|nr:hypothetical protein [Pseudomonas aeruginosa]ELK4813734.1 hypothetical protein [Pseudomonas aeruginosa]MBH4440218.1 hypothetical protein [Pseudomonas aeruginosa]MBW1094520.1 hypothetical protein [Pseudomonas aeruginosa]MDU0728172.1 hypothetical protein [Pseudomonas aeruginosa]MDY1109821.1 hypothetical protein [Pseudomonas aeruginosa]